MREREGSIGAPDRLRCEYLHNPLGIEEPSPRLSWQIRDPQRSAVQSAYQVQVASSPELLASHVPDQWDSGKVATNQTIQVEYKGQKLQSHRRYHWRVRTWDGQGLVSPWSRLHWWEMGIMESDLWKGHWIGPPLPENNRQPIPCPYLRREIIVKGQIRRARVYITARGLYELYINGRRVGEDYFTPGWTEYHHRIPYQTYDVTEYFREGPNAIGAILGDGWYGGHVGGFMRLRLYGPAPRLLAQLELETEDGTTQIIRTDTQWRISDGPILVSDFMRGEQYDARLEMPGWNEVGFDDRRWRQPVAEPLDHVKLVAQAMPTVRSMMILAARSRTQVRPGVWVFDMGQNMVGVARMQVQGPTGATIRMRYGEAVNSDGTLYTDNYRTAQCVDEYTVKGDDDRDYGPRHHSEAPLEIYQPRFTFRGFRYVELTGYPGDPPLTAISGIVLYSANDATGEFECSDPMLNQLHSNIVWSQRGNFLEIPTDCPQRDERLGWMGDAQVFIPTACFNMDVAAFFAKWMRDVELSQRADGAFSDVVPNALAFRDGECLNFDHHAWADAAIVVPWTLYQYYGDRRILERYYPAMGRWIEHCRLNSDGLIRPVGGYGDWLSVDAQTPTDLLNTAWFARSTWLMRRIAAIIGRNDDATTYERLFLEICRAFNHRFVTPASRIIGDSQTSYALALCFDLLPESARQAATAHLVENIRQRNDHLSTGFVGTPWLLNALSDNGRTDVAYRLLHQQSYPSWLFAVTHGATTIWERWDGWTPQAGFLNPYMNSLNHYAFGAVGQWMYQNIGGINPDPEYPAFGRFIIHPRPLESGLSFARTKYHSIVGTIASAWHIHNDHWTLTVRVPPNTQAEVVIPTDSLDQVTERGLPLNISPGLTDCREDGKLVRFLAGAGQYEFIIEIERYHTSTKQ